MHQPIVDPAVHCGKVKPRDIVVEEEVLALCQRPPAPQNISFRFQEIPPLSTVASCAVNSQLFQMNLSQAMLHATGVTGAAARDFM